MRKQKKILWSAQNLDDLTEQFFQCFKVTGFFCKNLGWASELCWSLQNVPTKMKRLEVQRYETSAKVECNEKKYFNYSLLVVAPFEKSISLKKLCIVYFHANHCHRTLPNVGPTSSRMLPLIHIYSFQIKNGLWGKVDSQEIYLNYLNEIIQKLEKY